MLFIFTAALLCTGLAFADADRDYVGYDSAPGPGMEEKKVNNDVTVLMPTGSKMRRRNETTQIMEGVDEYTARKLVDMNKRLDKIEQDIAEIKNAVLYLKSKLSDTGKSPNEGLPKDAER